MSKKVAIFLAEGLEECEALVTLDILRRANIETDTVSIDNSLLTVSSHHVPIVADKLIDEVCLDDYDCLVLPGGIPGTPNLEACEMLMDAVKHFAATDGKYIAAICAAPSIFAHAGLVEGVNATANPYFQEDMVKGGAYLQKDAPVVVDSQIITSQGMGTAIDFGYAIVSELLGDEAIEAVRQGIVDLRD